MKISPLADAVRQMIWAEMNNCSPATVQERAAILDVQINKAIDSAIADILDKISERLEARRTHSEKGD